jgi:hypothetical protein
MQNNEMFNKTTQFVAVRGSFPASDGLGRNFLLTREGQHGNEGSQQYDGTNFWSGVTTIPKSMIGTTISYKFVILNSYSETADVAIWENVDNRTFVVGGDTTLHWKYWDVNIEGQEISVDEPKEIPITYSLMQNYPNPFNPTTKIQYLLPVVSRVRLSVYNSLGQEVMQLVNENQSAGKYIVDFNAQNLSSGVYFYRLQTSKFVDTKKMSLLK